jgi:hypothetical protein
MTIATRTLRTALGDLRIETDAPERQGDDVMCAYRILGPRTVRRSRMTAVDGVQALQLVMERIGAELRASPEFEAGPLRWLDMLEPGFPLPGAIADLGWKAAEQNVRRIP